MPEVHKVPRFKGGDKALSATNPNYLTWTAAQDGNFQSDLSEYLDTISGYRRGLEGSGENVGTCFAVVEYFNATRSSLRYKVGSSQVRLNLNGAYYKTTTKKTVSTLTGHAEIAALTQAINDVVLPDGDYTRFVTRLYVELSPCPLCGPQLAPYITNSVLMYSYTHGDESEMSSWESDNQAGVHFYYGKLKR